MAKITRKTAKLFATTGAGTDVEQFASFEVNGVPNYTTSPAVIMAPIGGVSYWSLGWSATQFDGIFAPYFQDRNAVDLVFLYQIAYLLQQGVAEWDSATPYFTDSVVQNGGSIYLSLQDNNLGNAPPAEASNALWRWIQFPYQANTPTRTVLTTGSGTYTPPAGCVRVFVRLVGGGAGGASWGAGTGGSGGATTLGTLSAGGGTGGTGGAGTGVKPGGAGGVASGGFVNLSGAPGTNGVFNSVCGSGGSSKFGGAGAGISGGDVSGNSASANSGSGGSGASENTAVPSGIAYGGGGGAGAYLEAVILSPTSMTYSVGAGGAGSAASFATGGNGAAGIIIIDEFYY